MIHNKIVITLALLTSLALSLQAEYIRDDNKKIVLDSASGLMWQDDAVGSLMDWTKALTTCENLTLGGYSDWRLPNHNELYNLADKSRVNPSISPVFTNIISGSYWSSTTVAGSTSNGWRIYFGFGDSDEAPKTFTYYVRCVRGGL